MSRYTLEWTNGPLPEGTELFSAQPPLPAQEPAFKWRSVFQEMPAENSHILFCFGVHIVEGSFTKNGWASLAYGTAQPDFWAYFPPPPHHKRNQELYAMPPKREWVGLTPEETSGFTQHEMTVVKYVSKVLQEKNNGT
jgi:hypothetical protein